MKKIVTACLNFSWFLVPISCSLKFRGNIFCAFSFCRHRFANLKQQYSVFGFTKSLSSYSFLSSYPSLNFSSTLLNDSKNTMSKSKIFLIFFAKVSNSWNLFHAMATLLSFFERWNIMIEGESLCFSQSVNLIQCVVLSVYHASLPVCLFQLAS